VAAIRPDRSSDASARIGLTEAGKVDVLVSKGAVPFRVNAGTGGRSFRPFRGFVFDGGGGRPMTGQNR